MKIDEGLIGFAVGKKDERERERERKDCKEIERKVMDPLF